LSLQNLDDDLLFFNQERTNDSFTDALVTAGASVRARYGLETLSHARPLLWTRGRDPVQLNLAVTAFRDRAQLLDVVIDQFSAWRFHYSTTIGVCVVTQPPAKRQSL